MKDIALLSLRYLVSRPLTALLNLLLLSLGLASITFVLLVSAQLDRAFERDLAGIDAVVGASVCRSGQADRLSAHCGLHQFAQNRLQRFQAGIQN